MKKMGVKRSKIWAHYTPCGLFKAKCLICHRAVSYLGGSTGNLSRHVRLKHGGGTDTPIPAAEHLPLQETFGGEDGIQEAEVVVGADWTNMAVAEEEVVSGGGDHSGYTVSIKGRSQPTNQSPPSAQYSAQDESALFGAFVAARLRQLKGSRQRAAAHKRIIDLLCQIETGSVSPPQQMGHHGGQQGGPGTTTVTGTPVLFVEHAEWADNSDQIQSIVISPDTQQEKYSPHQQ